MNEWQSKQPEENYTQQGWFWESPESHSLGLPRPVCACCGETANRLPDFEEGMLLKGKGSLWLHTPKVSVNPAQRAGFLFPSGSKDLSLPIYKVGVLLFQLFQSRSQEIMDIASAVYKPKSAETKSGRQWLGQTVLQGEPRGEHFLNGNLYWGLPGILEKCILIQIDVCRGARD